MQILTRWSIFNFLTRKSPILSFLFVLVLIAGLACGPAALSTVEPTPGPSPEPSIEPSPVPVEVPAPIESVSMTVSDSYDSTADLVVVSGLPNACHSFGRYEIEWEVDTLTVSIFNTRPGDQMMACAEIYGLVTTMIPVPEQVETCKFYEVVINGESYSVQAIAPNVRCAGPSTQSENQVELVLGEKAVFDWTDLELTLIEVSEDSRCPSDVTCVWAGQATAVIKVEMYQEVLGEFSLTLGEDPDQNLVPVDNYTIGLISLEPYPVSTEEIAREEYVALVEIGLNEESEGVQELKKAP